MKDLFKDIRGWLALAVVAVTIAIIGFSKFLTKNLNTALIVLLAVSVLTVIILNMKKPGDKTE